ncbi:outer membrane beta-barrel protein [Shewanella amazonensis]|uniref:Uncharacterized protein n=1 Tax=Shewanella amazonensis (strain ATCC BAA-1098 / SB2B) TaxID=326297 RepID=A1S749_SHEAM|nr:outer membrane beta-barrel protein [Shewanella amazonensis]ABM00206.1 conserved hypothetical protein [Shewanella amazonensis SB2B]
MRATSTLLLMALAGFSQCALAKDMTLRVGGFYSQSDSSIDVTDPVIGEDFRLDFESDLQLAENQFLPFIEFEYAFGDRHNFYLDWKRLHRSAETNAVTRPFDVQIDDTVYSVKAGGQLNTTLNIDVLRLGYGYDLLQGDNYSLGITLGLHTMFIESVFEGAIGACLATELDGDLCSQRPIPRIVENSVTAPLPDIGLIGHYEFLPGWRFSAHGQYFAIKLDDLDGSLTDIRAGVSADLGESWSLSLAYNYYKVDVDVTQSAENIKVADYNIFYKFVGPMISVSYRF